MSISFQDAQISYPIQIPGKKNLGTVIKLLNSICKTLHLDCQECSIHCTLESFELHFLRFYTCNFGCRHVTALLLATAVINFVPLLQPRNVHALSRRLDFLSYSKTRQKKSWHRHETVAKTKGHTKDNVNCRIVPKGLFRLGSVLPEKLAPERFITKLQP